MPQQSHRVLEIDGSSDPILHHIAPLGLATSRGTAVVVDLDPVAPAYRALSLRHLLVEGAKAMHLRPDQAGVAVFANGGVAPEEARELIDALCEGWPAVVLRTRGRATGSPLVPVRLLLPPPLEPTPTELSVYQAISPGQRGPGSGPVLPRLRRSQIVTLLSGRIEPGWRWVRAWRTVWELPWA